MVHCLSKTNQIWHKWKKGFVQTCGQFPHLTAKRAIQSNYNIAGFLSGANQQEEQVRPVVPVTQCAAQMEAMVLVFVAENDLPFTMTPRLIELMNACSKDRKALGEVKLNRRTASYKMVHDVSKTITDTLVGNLKQTAFSLNIDESTTKSQKKVLAVLVSWFNETKNQIVFEHLDSFEVVRADAQSIYSGIVEIFEKNHLPWKNLVSILMDSCNTMRGAKGGVETLIITNKAPHLLDIDGDTVHHAHNAAKAFCAPFHNWLEQLFKDLHADFHWSTDLRDKLAEICGLLDIKYTVPERFLNHRFLPYKQADVGPTLAFGCMVGVTLESGEQHWPNVGPTSLSVVMVWIGAFTAVQRWASVVKVTSFLQHCANCQNEHIFILHNRKG